MEEIYKKLSELITLCEKEKENHILSILLILRGSMHGDLLPILSLRISECAINELIPLIETIQAEQKAQMN
jgi:hypothetical protein